MVEPKPKTAAEEVFAAEFAVLSTAERIATEGLPNVAEWQREFSELVRKYRALLKQAVKMTGIGDTTQSRLLRIQHELEAKNRELLEKNQALIRAQEALLHSQVRAQTIFSAYTEALPGTVLDGRYRLERKIGAGGYGAVYEATHLALNTTVAVKILQPRGISVTPEELDRFKREGISACRVQHPNAVNVIDFGISSNGLAYLVMELLQGITLGQELKRLGRLSPSGVWTSSSRWHRFWPKPTPCTSFTATSNRTTSSCTARRRARSSNCSTSAWPSSCPPKMARTRKRPVASSSGHPSTCRRSA
ncbi:protein kinase [Chloracidobacterium thermophilum]|nr:protein kinase [Chloracidobacterium thermophilum]